MQEPYERLKTAREGAGFRSPTAAARAFGWNEITYRSHENGTRGLKRGIAERYARAFRVRAGWLLTGENLQAVGETRTSVPVMGYLGQRAMMEPEFEQVPPEGLETIELPFPVPDGLVAFSVLGETMLPVYREKDVILVWREQRLATDSYVGEEAAVRTAQGVRCLKEIQHGPRRGLYNLHSHNARLMEGVRIAWVGEIFLIVKAEQIARAHPAAARAIAPEPGGDRPRPRQRRV